MHSCRLIVSGLVTLVCYTADAQSPPSFVSGLWKQGHNITEPRPKSSKFMKMLDAGFLVSGPREAYRADIQVSSSVPTPYFMQASFENPKDPKKPFTEETVVSQPKSTFSLTHGPAKGLRIYRDYRITVKIFRQKGDTEPLDVLEQTVRSYIDTTGPIAKLKGGMRSQ